MKRQRKTNSEVNMMSKVNTIRNIVHRNIERQLVREYLLKETERAGFQGICKGLGVKEKDSFGSRFRCRVVPTHVLPRSGGMF